jgi:hypothetical protein
MEPIGWVVIALVVIALVALAAWVVMRQRRREALRSRFGPEYDRMVEHTGNRREAESRLGEVADRRDQLDIRELDPAARARYDEQWDAVQVRFVDEPGQAVADADGLVTAVMRERGYPIEDFEDRASLVAADHADVVQHYRAAHTAHARHMQSGTGDTEDLRQAFVHYRSLYGALTGGTPQDGPPRHRDEAAGDYPMGDYPADGDGVTDLHPAERPRDVRR